MCPRLQHPPAQIYLAPTSFCPITPSFAPRPLLQPPPPTNSRSHPPTLFQALPLCLSSYLPRTPTRARPILGALAPPADHAVGGSAAIGAPHSPLTPPLHRQSIARRVSTWPGLSHMRSQEKPLASAPPFFAFTAGLFRAPFVPVWLPSGALPPCSLGRRPGHRRPQKRLASCGFFDRSGRPRLHSLPPMQRSPLPESWGRFAVGPTLTKGKQKKKQPLGCALGTICRFSPHVFSLNNMADALSAQQPLAPAPANGWIEAAGRSGTREGPLTCIAVLLKSALTAPFCLDCLPG